MAEKEKRAEVLYCKTLIRRTWTAWNLVGLQALKWWCCHGAHLLSRSKVKDCDHDTLSLSVCV